MSCLVSQCNLVIMVTMLPRYNGPHFFTIFTGTVQDFQN